MLRDVFTKTLRDHWHGIVGWGAGLALMALIELLVYPSVRNEAEGFRDLFEAYPEAMKAFMGVQEDFTSGPGFLATELFGFLLPLVLLSVGISFGSGATAGEEERRTADLLMANPLTRTRVVLEKAAAMVVALALVGAGLAIVLWVGVAALDMGVGWTRILAAVGGGVLLGALYGAVALLVGCLTGHRWLAAGVSTALALGAYLLSSLAPLVDALQPWRGLSPFHWYAGAEQLTDGARLGGLGLLTVCALAVTWLAVLAFDRRDIGT